MCSSVFACEYVSMSVCEYVGMNMYLCVDSSILCEVHVHTCACVCVIPQASYTFLFLRQSLTDLE